MAAPMSVYSDWNLRDLAKAAHVDATRIVDWYHRGLLRGEDINGVLRFPLIESVAVYALRDGQDPQAARDELLAGRRRSMQHHPARFTEEQIEDKLQDFLVANRLPQPKRTHWGDGDTRKEKE